MKALPASLAALLICVASVVAPVSTAHAATPGAQYFVTAYDGTVWEVTAGSISALSYPEWQALGYPAPAPAATDYVRYAWSTSVSAVTFFGSTRDRWVWQYLSPEQFSRAGNPGVRTAAWIAGSTFHQWATSPQIFVTDPGGVTHALTAEEWRLAEYPAFEFRANQGYQRLAWDSSGSIAFMCDIAAGRGEHVNGDQWGAAGYPQPQAVQRTARDNVWWWGPPTPGQPGSGVITYQGAINEIQLSYPQWTGLGSPGPGSRRPSSTYSCNPDPLPPGDDGLFTIATYPDTQQEVFDWAGTRFVDRSRWLVSQKDALDLRFVTHTGDVVNWDTAAHEQYVVAEAALDPLEAAGIPYQLSIGNHDSLATGPGGGARDARRTREYQRTTTTFNEFWNPSDYAALGGMFEDGKVDNTYSTFSAAGANWLVLNLELWPRIAAVDWAEQVISSHTGHNVIIQTHSLLDAAADVDGAGQSVTRWQYGDASPQYVYDRLVSPYSNVKVVMSGHVGVAASKVVTTPSGNNVAHLLQTMHSNTNNPVRLSQFDIDRGVINTRIFAPQDGAILDVQTLSGLTFITG